jgi:RNA polymerase sigma-70 factor (ECF subfamily)
MLTWSSSVAWGRVEARVSQDALATVRAAARGDRDATRVLAHRLLPRIRRIVRAVLGPRRQDAHEDVVQSCMLQTLRSLDGFAGKSSLETWATSIVIRHALKHVRRERQLEAVVDATGDPGESVSLRTEASFADALPRPLEEYLREIPEIHRVAVVLRWGFGYSLEEIAELTNTSANTVKARLRNGKLKLRALVDAEAEGKEPR